MNPAPDSPLRPSVHRDTFDLFAAYERRFLEAARSLPVRRPWVEAERRKIVKAVRKCLAIRDEWIPEIRVTRAAVTPDENRQIEHLQAGSWSGVSGAADLYLPPERTPPPWPAVLLACGHGRDGKRTAGYRWMAAHLARHGMAVLVPDNIGQGERKPMGHWDVVDVFACGLTLQGLIVMETLGWLHWLRNDPRFDARRMAAIGNSGGGTLTMFLGALCAGELAALSSSAYPSTFDHVARKEKKHCHCNVLPHIVGELEMWQILGCAAPTPMLIFQGKQDHFFPADLFRHLARKVAAAYEFVNAGDRFQAHLLEGDHSWDLPRRRLLTRFLCETLGVPFHPDRVTEETPLREIPPCFSVWPEAALTADALARRLSGHRGPVAHHLWEVFPPRPPWPGMESSPLLGTDFRQIAAQFEAFLK